MIEYLGIQCSPVSTNSYSNSSQKTRELYIKIHTNKQNVVKFSEEIGYRIHKQKIADLRTSVIKIKSSLK